VVKDSSGCLNDGLGNSWSIKIEDREISLRKEFKSPTLTPVTVLEVMSQALLVPVEVLIDKKGPYRNLAVYRIKKYTTVPNKAIGQLFENISYSTVSQIAIRFEKRLEADADLRQITENIKNLLSNVKGCPQFVPFGALTLAILCAVAVTPQAQAISYTGSLTGQGGGIIGTQDWDSASTALSWTVKEVGTSGGFILWEYDYTFTVPNKGISHVIIEVSPGQTIVILTSFWETAKG